MFKWLSVLALFAGLQAHANDGGIVLVDVLGIAPAQGITKTEVKLYGKDTKRLAQVLPVTDVMGGRSVHMASDKWVSYIYCQKQYERPTNGETRNDWMCTIGLEPRAGSIVDMDEGDKTIAEASMFTDFSGSNSRKALGILPSPERGLLFSVYGDRLNLLAERLPEVLTFNSPSYMVELNCGQNYERPTTGEVRNDYLCQLYVSAPN